MALDFLFAVENKEYYLILFVLPYFYSGKSILKLVANVVV